MLNQGSEIDRVFRVLGDPTRRAIVDQLSRGQASVSELARPLEITLAAVVQHIQALEEAGVVKTEKVGRSRICRIQPGSLSQVERWLASRRAMWERNLDRLGDLLEEQP